MDEKPDEFTVFVRNIAFSVDEEKLSGFFSDVGPVRKAFLVRPRSAETHKGFGFVAFAIKEDAVKAATQLAGRKLDGRALQVELAKKRDSLHTRNLKRRAQGCDTIEPGNHRRTKALRRESGDHLAAVHQAEDDLPSCPQESAGGVTGKKRHPSQVTATEKAHLCKAVAIGCIPEGCLSQTLQLAKQAGPVVNIDDGIPSHVAAFAKLRQDGCEGHSVLAHYESGKAAFVAVWAIHNVSLAQSGSKSKKGTLWARQVNGEGAQVKKWRIILRNIPFGTSEAELSQLLGKVGFVWRVTIPTQPNGRMKGFAFAAFTCRAHAEAAIAAVNGKEYKGRLLAADWSIPKAAFADFTGNGAPIPHDGETYDVSVPITEHATVGSGPQLASSGEESASDMSDTSNLDASNPDVEMPRKPTPDLQSDDSDADVSQGSSLEDAAGGNSVVTEEEKKTISRVLDSMLALPAQPPVSKGVASDANREGVGMQHDNLAAASLTAASKKRGRTKEEQPTQQQAHQQKESSVEPAAEWAGDLSCPAGDSTGRGSGGEIRRQVFVRNLPLAITEVELSARMSRYGNVKACRLVMNPVTKLPKGTAFIEFDSPAGAQKAAGVSQAQRDGTGPGITIQGQIINVDIALEQDSARQLAKSQSKAAAGKGLSADARNLYLEHTHLVGFSRLGATKRNRQDKSLQLKEGRIEEDSSLWNSLSAGDQNKRRRALAEAKVKLKSPNFFLSLTRLHIINVPQPWDEKRLKRACMQAVLERASSARPKIKQVVILRDATRLDDNNNTRSRGIGFVEFETHEDALICLRQLNNNPTSFGSADRRPIVGFAVESVKVLKIRDQRMRLQQEHASQRAAAEVPQSEQAQEENSEQGRANAYGASELDSEALKARGLKRRARNARRQQERRLKLKGQQGRHRQLPPHAGTIREDTLHEANNKRRKRSKTRPSVDGSSVQDAKGSENAGKRYGAGHSQAVNSGKASNRSVKTLSQDSEEAAKHQVRKKEARDEAVDRLAKSGEERPLKAAKRRKAPDTDALDALITKRTRSLFGLTDDSKYTSKTLDTRWFQ